jgi:peptidoglycan/LPS O-acetylase OafA/YrhL
MNNSYRADIDGLRGLAISSVVIYHLFPAFLPGGFIGVDIFFVISGFLITTIIYQNIQSNSFSFYGFYAKRIRRILPALLIVLATVYAIGYLSLFSSEYRQLGKHIYSGALFFINISLWQETGYFDIDSELKPLLHLWSLAIEEQFYIVWPILIFLVVKLRLNHLWLFFLLGGASFIISIYYIYTAPVSAFYLPISRFWELVIGSLIGYLSIHSIHFSKICNQNKNWLSLVGVSLIFLSIVFFNKKILFPGWWALLPVVGSSLIILAKDSKINKLIFSSKPLMYLGLISFSLYLWHWPLISFVKIWNGSKLSYIDSFLILFLSLFLAYLSYKFVEQPARRQKNKLVIFLIGISVLIAGSGYSVYSRDGLEFRHQKIIKGYGGKAPHSDFPCLQKFSQYQPEFCNLAISTQVMSTVILGDSIANNNYPGIAKKYLEKNVNIGMIGWPGTQPLIGFKESFDGDLDHMNKVNKLITGVADDSSIQNVILSMTHPSSLDDQLLNRIQKTIQILKEKNKNIYYVFAPPPLSFEPIQCIGMPPLRPQIKHDCSIKVSEINQSYFDIKFKLKNLLDRMNIPTYDPYDQLCDKELCQVKVGGELLYRTQYYLSLKGSEHVFSKFPTSW